MLGVFLQLKQGAGMTSLFNTYYITLVILIVTLILYGGSLIGGTYILQAHLNSDLAKFMTKISLFLGALAVVLELKILVPDLGLAALIFWIVCFMSFVALYSWVYVKTLYKSAFAGVVYGFEKLKEYVNMIFASFTVKAEEQTGLP
ncbi:hypothetical protein Pyn_15167 [Prunus yedoensis var. nudiflora]|uniref:Uncharacterized protein n=1 Tax=Prunus yedoensis var. nudiflora TaxID=2094558 RepID=A0A314UUY0_PRUYE|nr:hypothetical protein Pyn_15167 [Prunus yedoensis var. nudiflora]